MMTPTESQVDVYEKTLVILKANMLACIVGQERVGKTLPALMVAESVKVKSVLIITKKAALVGWKHTMDNYETTKDYTVTNYHQVHKIKKDFDLVILDESHNYISAFPTRSNMWESVNLVVKGKPLIYLTATPNAQGFHLLYNQLAMSSWSPWLEWPTPEDWFTRWGTASYVYTKNKQGMVAPRKKWNKIDPDVMKLVQHLFITKTRQEAGFTHEPNDVIHYVELSEETKRTYNIIVKKRALVLNGWDLVCDSPPKLRAALHMLEGGVALVHTPEMRTLSDREVYNNAIRYLFKDENKNFMVSELIHIVKKILLRYEVRRLKPNYIQLKVSEKIDYIKEIWGDTEDLVIMYHFKAEAIKLELAFTKATVLQADTNAEGVDLSEFENLVIYSQSFSTAKHSQRRARQANMNRKNPINVHFLLVKGGASDKVYEAVAINKVNFVDSMFQAHTI